MKNLPAIVVLSTVAILLLLAVAASLVPSLSFASIASYILGFSCAAGTLAFLVADYGPGSPRPIAVPARNPEAEGVRESTVKAGPYGRRVTRAVKESQDEAATEDLMASIRMRNDPATLSLL